jgi:hypothetical protein
LPEIAAYAAAFARNIAARDEFTPPRVRQPVVLTIHAKEFDHAE